MSGSCAISSSKNARCGASFPLPRGGPYGFGGIGALSRFATNGCTLTGRGAIGAWEVDDDAAQIGLKQFLEDLQENGRPFIGLQPGLSLDERTQLLDTFR